MNKHREKTGKFKMPDRTKQKIHLAPPFKKGQSGNPKGRPKEATSQRVLRKYTKEEIAKTLNHLMEQPLDKLDMLRWAEDTPAIDAVVASVLYWARANGDWSQVEKLLDRCIGKVPQKLEGEGFGGGAVPITVVMEAVEPEGKA